MSIEIEKAVRRILNDNIILDIPVEQIGIEDDLFNLGMDSINSIKVIVALECEFNFEFADEDLNTDNIQSIGKIVAYVSNKMR